MIAIRSNVESTAIDERTVREFHIPPACLMESAARAMLPALEQETGDSPILFVCGAGRNGGDGLAMARAMALAGRKSLSAVLCGRPESEPMVSHLLCLERLGIPVLDFGECRAASATAIRSAGLVVDAICGSRLSSPLREPAAALRDAICDSKGRVVSIDLPSGLYDGLVEPGAAVGASVTLSIEPVKRCLFEPGLRGRAGRIRAIKGIFPRETMGEGSRLLGEEDLELFLEPIPPTAHKYGRGLVVVLAGSVGMTGAAMLASEAAARSGAGLVALYADPDIYPILAAGLRSEMVKPIPPDGNLPGIEKAGSLLVGPGWGGAEGRKALLARALSKGIPAVIDADAIALYDELVREGFSPSAKIVLTPHLGEYRRLSGSGSGSGGFAEGLAREARRLRSTIVMKAESTWIVDEDGSTDIVDGYLPALGTGGSGDILAGTIAGLMTSGLAPAKAARAGTLAHRVAGGYEQAESGWFLAEDLPRRIGALLGKRSV